jgi:hypothetical protein
MTDEREQALGMIEDAIAALVVQKHGQGRLIVAWELMIETIDPSSQDVTSWTINGGGLTLAQRGIIGVCCDRYRGSIGRVVDDE